jgi:hypothetical protein
MAGKTRCVNPNLLEVPCQLCGGKGKILEASRWMQCPRLLRDLRATQFHRQRIPKRVQAVASGCLPVVHSRL